MVVARALRTIYSLDFWFFLSRKRTKKKIQSKEIPLTSAKRIAPPPALYRLASRAPKSEQNESAV
jgi:hypothetical protein